MFVSLTFYTNTPYVEILDPASMSDWGKTEYKFDCKFSDDLKIFIIKTLRGTLIAVHNIVGKKVVL